MKVQILRDADYRLAPSRVQAFRAGSVVNIPRATAQALIASGAAKPVKSQRVAKEKSHG